jgi:hypothetical protein
MVLLKSSLRKENLLLLHQAFFSSSILMVQPANDPLPVPVESFFNNGLPVYAFAQDNHAFWDTCNCEDCYRPDIDDDSPKQKRKSSGKN